MPSLLDLLELIRSERYNRVSRFIDPVMKAIMDEAKSSASRTYIERRHKLLAAVVKKLDGVEGVALVAGPWLAGSCSAGVRQAPLDDDDESLVLIEYIQEEDQEARTPEAYLEELREVVRTDLSSKKGKLPGPHSDLRNHGKHMILDPALEGHRPLLAVVSVASKRHVEVGESFFQLLRGSFMIASRREYDLHASTRVANLTGKVGPNSGPLREFMSPQEVLQEASREAEFLITKAAEVFEYQAGAIYIPDATGHVLAPLGSHGMDAKVSALKREVPHAEELMRNITAWSSWQRSPDVADVRGFSTREELEQLERLSAGQGAPSSTWDTDEGKGPWIYAHHRLPVPPWSGENMVVHFAHREPNLWVSADRARRLSDVRKQRIAAFVAVVTLEISSRIISGFSKWRSETRARLIFALRTPAARMQRFCTTLAAAFDAKCVSLFIEKNNRLSLQYWSLGPEPELDFPIGSLGSGTLSINPETNDFAAWPEFLKAIDSASGNSEHTIKDQRLGRNVTLSGFHDPTGLLCVLRVDDMKSEVAGVVPAQSDEHGFRGYCPPVMPDYAQQMLIDASDLLSLYGVSESVGGGQEIREPRKAWARLMERARSNADRVALAKELDALFLQYPRVSELMKVTGLSRHLLNKDFNALKERGYDPRWGAS